jgi:hypothetical protein
MYCPTSMPNVNPKNTSTARKNILGKLFVSPNIGVLNF